MTSEGIQHPKGLSYLCFAEIWERLGFYVIQALLVLYLIHQYHFSDEASYNLLGTFTALVYMMPVVGGYLADNIIGRRLAIMMGCIFLAMGYALLIIPSLILLKVSLTLIIIGNGFFKPNLTSLVGLIYGDNNQLKESGFTILYICTNLGVIASMVTSGLLIQYVSWSASFVVASCCLFLAFASFWLGLQHYQNANACQPKPATSSSILAYSRHPLSITVPILGLMAMIFFLMDSSQFDNTFLIIVAFGLIGLVVYRGYGLTRHKQLKLYVCLIMAILAIVFFALDFQLLFSVNLFIKRAVDRNFFGWTIPIPFFIALTSVCIVSFGSLVNKLWHYLERYKMNPTPPMKMVFSFIWIGLGFSLLSMGAMSQDAIAMVSPIWIFVAYFCIAIGELFCMPICLAMIANNVPSNMVGFMIGVWFVYAAGVSGKIAGLLANISVIPANTSFSAMKHIYAMSFMTYAGIACITALVALLIALLLKKLLASTVE